MTLDKSAQQHLAKAKEYIAKGEEFYRHAAAEMELAAAAGATQREIATAIGRDQSWCSRIMAWAKLSADDATAASPFSDANDTTQADRRERNYAKAALSDPVKVTEIVNTLPKEAVYEIEKAVANRLGAPIVENQKLAGDPVAVVRAFDKLTPEQQEMAAVDIAQSKRFTEALKANPVVRDDVIHSVLGSPAERKERKEEIGRKSIEKGVTIHGWQEVNSGLGDANRGLVNVLSALSKLIVHAPDGFDPDSDPLGVSHARAEAVGRSIYEIEAAWGHTPFTDKIMELRSQYADRS